MKTQNATRLKSTFLAGFICFLTFLISLHVTAQSGTIKGTVTDKDTKEVMPFVNILILSGNQQVAGTTSDFDGKFKFINIPAGEYDLKATMVGYTPYFKKKIKVRLDSVLTVNITMESNGVSLDEVQVIQYAVPLIDHDKTSVGAPKKTKAVQTPSTFQTPPTRVEETNLDYQAGQLTASELNDFSKWDLWKDIEANDLKEMQKLWRLSPDNRYSVQVKGNNNKPVVPSRKVYPPGMNRQLPSRKQPAWL